MPLLFCMCHVCGVGCVVWASCSLANMHYTAHITRPTHAINNLSKSICLQQNVRAVCKNKDKEDTLDRNFEPKVYTMGLKLRINGDLGG